VKLLRGYWIWALAFSSLAGQAVTKPEPLQATKPLQRFVCNTGYQNSECRQQLRVLQSALAPYPSQRLGTWTWILVKTPDWKPIVQRLGGNTDSPAFSIVEKRQTFLEEALLVPVGSRRAELLRVWLVPLDKLLDVAITHELGHSICEDLDEGRADNFGRLLREGKNAECGPSHR
jgi:hypothetical protein